MKQLEDESVDLVVTDPPYGINYHSNYGTEEYKKRIHNINWDDSFHFGNYFDDVFRVVKNNAFIYVWGRFENYEIMKHLGCDRVLIWDKGHCGMGDLKDWGIGYELIYVFKKGRPQLKGRRVNGVIPFKHIGFFDKTLHPTQKPVEIIKFLITKSSNPSDLILDPFMGSGTTAVACKQLNRNFIGFELDPKYVEIANKRLAQGTLHSYETLKNFDDHTYLDEYEATVTTAE